jgi:hypothetical protein
MTLKQMLYGVATYVPGVSRLHSKGTGGTDSARYCYSVWLRHLVMAKRHGLNANPRVVAELGPGDSLGVGLVALLTGSEKYLAFDVVEHASTAGNLAILEELIPLVRSRAAIPGDDEFPGTRPRLDDYSFPADIFSQERLDEALTDERIERIRQSLRNNQGPDSVIQYKAPWYDGTVLEPESVDMIFSQAVMEHVNDVTGTYQAMVSWLKPDGYISHQIDFSCHGTADDWNGHWQHSEMKWKLIRGKRPYLLNREPHSTHLATLERLGFLVVGDIMDRDSSGIQLSDLAPRFSYLTAEDLNVRGALIQAVKKPGLGAGSSRKD